MEYLLSQRIGEFDNLSSAIFDGTAFRYNDSEIVWFPETKMGIFVPFGTLTYKMKTCCGHVSMNYSTIPSYQCEAGHIFYILHNKNYTPGAIEMDYNGISLTPYKSKRYGHPTYGVPFSSYYVSFFVNANGTEEKPSMEEYEIMK